MDMVERPDIYETLDNDKHEFRLIRMTLDDGQKIQCLLETFSHDYPPTYKALSYVWTKEPPSREILLNVHSFSVRPNLHEYLKQADHERCEDWIFADALCIDQYDNGERSSQVAMMGWIYRGAQGVIAWLGSRYPWEADSSCSDTSRILEFETFFDHSADDADRILYDQKLKHLASAALRIWFPWSYWSRLWITQEVLSSKAMVFRFQRFALNADSAYRMVLFYSENLVHPKKKIPTLYDNDERGVLLAKFFLDRRWECQYVFAATSLSIFDAVPILSQQRCREKYDSIFGLLGLTRSSLVPNYSMPVVELYLRVLIEGNLDYAIRQGHRWTSGSGLKRFGRDLLDDLDLSTLDPVVAFTTKKAWRLCKVGGNRSILELG